MGGLMVRVLVTNAVDHGFEPTTGQTKDNKNWCLLRFSLRLAWNRDNVITWGDMYIR